MLLLSLVVSQRSHEFGIRMALGAIRARVVRLIARQVAICQFGGSVGRRSGPIALSRVLVALLFGVTPPEADHVCDVQCHSLSLLRSECVSSNRMIASSRQRELIPTESTCRVSLMDVFTTV